jgi:hypothetical protein
MTTVTQAVTVGVADVEKAWTALKSDFEAKKAQLEAVVQSHIGSHQAQAAAHNAEVDAATAILNVINPPTATPATTASQAAAIVLTANTDASKVWSKIKTLWDAGWRYAIIGGAAAYIVYAIHAGLIK